jgi:hypothetical protein
VSSYPRFQKRKLGRPADERSSCQPTLSTMRLWKGWGTRHSPECCDEWATCCLQAQKKPPEERERI